jgi:hypothetical protein
VLIYAGNLRIGVGDSIGVMPLQYNVQFDVPSSSVLCIYIILSICWVYTLYDMMRRVLFAQDSVRRVDSVR